jgi:hypothetical protein
VAWLILVPLGAGAQSTAVLHGTVVDAQRQILPHAEICLARPAIGFERRATADERGVFRLTNVPLDTYELRVEFPGFSPRAVPVPLLTSVPVSVEVVLELATQSEELTVSPEPASLDTTSAGTRARISMLRIEQLPAATGSRGLESVLVSFPGFAQNANGAIHPRGAHNQMTYVVDGLPISDQLTGAFANALDASIVQTAELMTGNIPAEFGAKVSGVAVITSHSGLSVGRALTGDAIMTVAGYDTWAGTLQAGGGRGRLGYFGSLTTMRTDRFLDQVSLDNLHNAGGFARGFLRGDVQLSASDTLRLHAMGGRSAFQIANLLSQDSAGQDQRQRLADGALWTSYVRVLDDQSALEALAGYRATRAELLPSPADTPVTAAQDRRLSTMTALARYSRLSGAHTLRAGVDVQRFPVREHFWMGITSPLFNDPASPSFNAALLPHDLTRGGVPFVFDDGQTGLAVGGFVQATSRWRRATVTLGARYDEYAFLVSGHQVQPRVGLALQLPRNAGVLRASYNRNYQTPPNENLLLSSSQAASALAPDSVKTALGGSYRPIVPERQNVYEIGYQRPIGIAALDVSAYRKDSRDQQDNNNFFDTGIVFPTALAAIDVIGVESRLTFPPRRGVSGTASLTAGRAISTPPFTGGLFLGQDAVDLLSAGPFAIDHDQRLSVHATIQYDPPGGLWFGGSVRYDSGLVCNPSNPADVASDPDFAGLLPFVDLTAAVPRVRPRTIADVNAGFDVMRDNHRTWSVQVQVTNLTNQTALYNFQSVFVGTRLVQPRTLAVRVKRHF